MVLEERGASTMGKTADWMRQTLAEHSDFKDEKSMIEHMLMDKGHVPCFLPKFHPELNPIERVWAQLKRFTKVHCKYVCVCVCVCTGFGKSLCHASTALLQIVTLSFSVLCIVCLCLWTIPLFMFIRIILVFVP